jgi:uncharacterized surface protein with fasciclin (FAS1) repeats
MQNILIVGAVVIIGVVGFFLLQSDGETIIVEDAAMGEPAMDDMMADDMMAAPAAGDIVETAIATPELSTLVAAVVAADLAETLQGPGPFTVFAPVNQAFAALPAGTVDTLLLPENIADLQAILTYHVVPGAVMAGDLTDGMVVETVNGQSLTINVSAAGVSINGSANVAIADIVTSNGVVHVIDAVLLPATE